MKNVFRILSIIANICIIAGLAKDSYDKIGNKQASIYEV